MLSKSTLDFLKSLKKNNNRDWFNAHKDEYEAAKTEFEIFIGDLIKEISRFDKKISGLKPKDCIFRIYRDVRFSKDKSPYKNHLGAFITYNGKTSNGPGYYIHLEPGNCLLAGGVYQPEGPQLNSIRQEIDYNLKNFRKILSNKEFLKYFKTLNDTEKLKTAPKGFPKDHPAIDLLQHKSFTVSHHLSDKQVLGKDFLPHCMKILHALQPLNKFLKTAID